MAKHMSRRNFLRTAAAVGVTAAVYRNAYGANEKLCHACIGVGGMMGGHDVGAFASHPKLQLVAICDVDKNHLGGAAKNAKDARQYTDWRELLAKEGDKVDSVNVTVPDHSHAIITLSALNLKKHVYTQKPLAHDVAECRAIAEAAKKAGTVTQLGTQVAATNGDRMGVKFLKDGLIGKAKRAILCSNRGGAVEAYRLVGPRPKKTDPVPSSLDWNVWLGTAPERPFVNGIYHPVKWRCWLDFGTGWSGDIGCHIFDAVWKGLGLTAPKSVIAEVQKSWQDSPERRADNWPQANHITWIFPGNDKTDGDLTLEWFDGEFYPPKECKEITGLERHPEEASFVIGTEGSLLLPHQGGPQLFPKEKFKGTPRPNMGGGSHYHFFVDACLGGKMTEGHFLQTGPMAEAIILGTVAVRCPGQKLEWDAANLKIPNYPEGEKFLRRTYREGWKVLGA
ncbi:MAG: Gfo/Idh/MocA family oxidoreductase [Planctomycetota bacterium]|nr:Gfo/Idh/MocA family oxidoreductase [Planctomycetota bacterium]